MTDEGKSDVATMRVIGHELRHHAPFTFLGAVSGIVLFVIFVAGDIDPKISSGLFWTFHPMHVFLSALATAGMYRIHSKRSLLTVILVGYVGAIGIATASDSVIPFLAESLLDWPDRHIHLGFIDKWWLVNPLALAGVAVAVVRPVTKFPHFGHVLLSTWASLFHMLMALGAEKVMDFGSLLAVTLFLFLAVWIPCCTSDIVFPLALAVPMEKHARGDEENHHQNSD